MNTIAREVFPTVTPSIGKGNASAAVAAATSAAVPTATVQCGGFIASAMTATTRPAIAANPTTRRTGRTRVVSVVSESDDQ
jgi:hypothetical protein